MDSLLYAVANTCEDFPGGIRAMAPAIGKNETTLAHEINGTGTAKLGLVTAAKIARRAKDARIPSAFAEACGGVFVPGPAMLLGDSGTLADLAQLSGDFADLLKEVSRSTADGKISDNERERIERAWGRMLVAGQVLMVHLRTEHENGKHPHLRAA